nr:appr-1-p processing enzyme family protein [Tanacetum cinerariifolium]GEV93393.1 appr-1-p processing enzyme family protein [Tanacetum cinerariifolium]
MWWPQKKMNLMPTFSSMHLLMGMYTFIFLPHDTRTVGLDYDDISNVSSLLSDAYRNSRRVERENKIDYVSFYAISCVYLWSPHKAYPVVLASFTWLITLSS